jgi:predicted nucleic acid-binding protein
MIIPRQVYNEISTVTHLQQRIDVMVNNGNLTIEDLLVGSEENNLYLDLTDYTRSSTLPLIGKGEAAAIVLSKKNNGILASNNFRDVRYYVELYGLDHISTPDILYKAFNDGLISNTEADSIWTQMLAKRRKLPFNTFTDYLNNL